MLPPQFELFDRFIHQDVQLGSHDRREFQPGVQHGRLYGCTPHKTTLSGQISLSLAAKNIVAA